MIMSSKIYRAKMSLAEEEHRVDEEQGAGGGIDLPSLASKMEQVVLFDEAVDTFVDGAVDPAAVVVVVDLIVAVVLDIVVVVAVVVDPVVAPPPSLIVVAAENLFIQAGAGA